MPFDPVSFDRPNRLIYRYCDGMATIAADPVNLWRKVNSECATRGTTWAKLTEQWVGLAAKDSDDLDTTNAKHVAFVEFQKTIIDVVRDAFGLLVLDATGDGLTEPEIMAILADFLSYREKKEPNTAN